MVGCNFFVHDLVRETGEGKSFAHNEIDFHLGVVRRESIDLIIRQNFKTRVNQQPDRLRISARIEITSQDHRSPFLPDLLQEGFALRDPQVLSRPIMMNAEQTNLSPILTRIDTRFQSASRLRSSGQDMNLMRYNGKPRQHRHAVFTALKIHEFPKAALHFQDPRQLPSQVNGTAPRTVFINFLQGDEIRRKGTDYFGDSQQVDFTIPSPTMLYIIR